jgi:asparagine synthase (glutamine-hydrolysing)
VTLEELFLPAVTRAPCLVAFSGGRDSSAILAMAAHVARRQGLPDPIPVTLRFPHNPRTWETEWQEPLIRHLGLEDWQTIDVHTELDAIGPLAREVLLRHGLYWPSNAHTMVPLLRAARGGSLLTGSGGDEVFNSLIRKRRLTPRELAAALPLRRFVLYQSLLSLPPPLRRRLWARRAVRLRWLRPAALREIRRRYANKHSESTWDLKRLLTRLDNSRYLELTRGIFPALARDAGAELHEPFLDPRFFRAVLEAAPREGYSSRNHALAAFFEDLLPSETVNRETKAVFTEVFSSGETRAFAEVWDGSGLDPALVDPEKLRLEWLKPKSDLRSLTPLQAAWLAGHGSR